MNNVDIVLEARLVANASRGNIHYHYGDFKLALPYYLQAAIYARELKDTKRETGLLELAGDCAERA